MFNYDWFHGQAYAQQKLMARLQCALQRFPDVDPSAGEPGEEFTRFHDELEERTLVYLRDGFSYEVRDIPEVETKSHLVFQCVPVDEQYKVGAFIVTVPFEEVVRVEVYAVHPDEKPNDLPQITGFHSAGDAPEPGPEGRHNIPGKPTR